MSDLWLIKLSIRQLAFFKYFAIVKYFIAKYLHLRRFKLTTRWNFAFHRIIYGSNFHSITHWCWDLVLMLTLLRILGQFKLRCTLNHPVAALNCLILRSYILMAGHYNKINMLLLLRKRKSFWSLMTFLKREIFFKSLNFFLE